jgi:hypothetical protein
VADMCKSSSAIEEANYGGYKVDSVLLRIMMQQSNCICRVTLDNQIQEIKTDNDITIALIMACYPYLFDNDI